MRQVQRGSLWLWWALALTALLWLHGCPPPTPTTCKSNADCGTGQVCKDAACTKDTPTDGKRTEKTDDAGTREPAPKPDFNLKEGRFPRPEGFKDGKVAATKGKRKVGETCNPSLAAQPQDSCEDGALCASPNRNGFGICRKTCSLQNANCPKGESCGPVPLIENDVQKGYVCAPVVPDFAYCTVGQHCPVGSRCIKYGSDNGGICQKVCKSSNDCGKGQWCGGGREVGSNLPFTVCAYLRAKAGESCGEHRMCGENLNCRGSGRERVCLRSCRDGNCLIGSECIKRRIGTTEIANCMVSAAPYSPCSSTVVCEQGSLCYTFSSSKQHRVCLKVCTGNEKACTKDEVCVTSGSRQYCMKANIQEGEACDGAKRCAKGLTCTAISNGPSLCLKDCGKDASVCSSEQTCAAVTTGSTHKRCLKSCSNSNKCARPRFVCSARDKGVCRLDVANWAGKVARNGLCKPFAAADASQRCGQGLRCISMKNNDWRCLQPCDSKNPNACGKPLQCMFSKDLDGWFCGEPKTSCNLAKSEFCPAGMKCLLEAGENTGVCQTLPAQEKGKTCDPEWLPCKKGLQCSGLPLTPFRWLCSTPCDSKTGKGCGANEICLPTGSGGACHPTCSSNSDCQQPFQTCTSIQQKKACL